MLVMERFVMERFLTEQLIPEEFAPGALVESSAPYLNVLEYRTKQPHLTKAYPEIAPFCWALVWPAAEPLK